MNMKLNIGCGPDLREGFINIDGSDKVGADMVVDLDKTKLRDHFQSGQFEFILAQDIIEHFYHWEAVEILKDCHGLLKDGGILQVRVPDCEQIINSNKPIEDKLIMLFGGQDLLKTRSEERKLYPNYFCHKYGWTRQSMVGLLLDLGYNQVRAVQKGTNFVTTAVKGGS